MDRHLVFEISHLVNICSDKWRENNIQERKTRKANRLFRCFCKNILIKYLGGISKELEPFRKWTFSFYMWRCLCCVSPPDDRQASDHFINHSFQRLWGLNLLFLIGCFSFDEINKLRQIYFSKAPLFFTWANLYDFWGDIGGTNVILRQKWSDIVCVRVSEGVRGCVRLCEAVWGYTRVCEAVWGWVRVSVSASNKQW